MEMTVSEWELLFSDLSGGSPPEWLSKATLEAGSNTLMVETANAAPVEQLQSPKLVQARVGIFSVPPALKWSESIESDEEEDDEIGRPNSFRVKVEKQVSKLFDFATSLTKLLLLHNVTYNPCPHHSMMNQNYLQSLGTWLEANKH